MSKWPAFFYDDSTDNRRKQMGKWGMIILVFVVAYLVGVKFPAIGQKALGTVGL